MRREETREEEEEKKNFPTFKLIPRVEEGRKKALFSFLLDQTFLWVVGFLWLLPKKR